MFIFYGNPLTNSILMSKNQGYSAHREYVLFSYTKGIQ